MSKIYAFLFLLLNFSMECSASIGSFDSLAAFIQSRINFAVISKNDLRETLQTYQKVLNKIKSSTCKNQKLHMLENLRQSVHRLDLNGEFLPQIEAQIKVMRDAILSENIELLKNAIDQNLLTSNLILKET